MLDEKHKFSQRKTNRPMLAKVEGEVKVANQFLSCVGNSNFRFDSLGSVALLFHDLVRRVFNCARKKVQRRVFHAVDDGNCYLIE